MNEDALRTAADLVLHNASILTFDPDKPRAGLVAVRGNRILAAGEQDDLDLFRGAGTRLIDCQGGTVIPGFNDAHCHPLAFAVGLLGVDCGPGAVTNIAAIQHRIRLRAGQSAEGEWIRAVNYDELQLEEQRPPNRRELDQACPRHPVILAHRTAGTCVLNSLALELSGITRDTPDPPGGSIHRDAETGEPNGLLSGRNEQLERALPPVGQAELERGMRLANQAYLSLGITSLQDTGWNNGLLHWRSWQRLLENGCVSPRVSVMLGSDALQECRDAGLMMGAGDERLRIGGIKLALDESTRCPHPPQSDIDRHALAACRAGFCVAFHVSDIGALEAALEAIRFVGRQCPGAEHRFRLEHCTICPPHLLLKIKSSRATVVTQPAFLYYMGEPYREEAAPHQHSWFQPLGSFRRWGVGVAFGSDSPLVRPNPLRGIYAAVTRRTGAGQGLAPREAVTVAEAIEMYTLGGAKAAFEEPIKGSISTGKLADLVVLDADLERIDPEQLPAAKVACCIVGGEVLLG